MAASLISGDFGDGPRVTCILNEGNPTVGTGYTPTGLKMPINTWAGELHRGEIVSIDPSTSNTYEACGGLPVVKAVANGEATIIGIIETEPKLIKKIPASTDADSLTKRLAGEYYRTATVRFFGIFGLGEAILKTADAGAVTPGVAGVLKVDVSESAGGANGLVLNDVTTGGTGIISFHYQAKAASTTVKLMVGFTGLMTGQT